MKCLKANILCLFGIALGVVAVGCGDAIQGSQSTAAMLGWVLLACACLATAIVLCALGVNAENERTEQQTRKIRRVPTHTNEWRDVQ